MFNLVGCRNVVYLSKSHTDWTLFVTNFLVKYENVTAVDYMKSTKSKKVFKTVKERRNLYTENKDFVIFSRGLLEIIPKDCYTLIEKSDYIIKTPQLTDEEIKKTLDVYDLRDDQVLAVKKCLYAKRGVIQLPTAVGKSSIITATVKRLLEVNPGMRSLVLAPTLTTVNNINDTLVKNGVSTSIYGHPSKDINQDCTVSLVQTLVSDKENNPHLLEGINVVFYDECLPSSAKVLLSDFTEVSIKSIYENDKINEVFAYNTETDTYEPKRILRKFRSPFNDRFCKVYYEDPISHKLAGVSCTLNHKIYTKNKGYVPAEELTSEDLIKIDLPFSRNWKSLLKYSYVPVVRVSKNVGKLSEYKYNLEIEDHHNYFANHVLVSNCHHLKCDTWNKLNTMLPNVEYSLGFSALSVDRNEIYENDIRNVSYDTALIMGSSGRVLMHMDPSYYIERGIIALPIVFRVNNYINLPEDFDESNWSKLSKLGLMSSSRTNDIAKIASMFNENNRKVLILVSERDYAFRICEYLVKHDCTNFGISFGAGTGYIYGGLLPPDEDNDLKIDYKSENSFDVLKKLDDGEINVLIATTHLDEGADINSLDACILASGGKKDRRIIQRLGRVLRKSKTGKYAYVIDFADNGSRVLSRQSRSRLKLYKEDVGVPEENLFDRIEVDNIENKFKELEGLSST